MLLYALLLGCAPGSILLGDADDVRTEADADTDTDTDTDTDSDSDTDTDTDTDTDSDTDTDTDADADADVWPQVCARDEAGLDLALEATAGATYQVTGCMGWIGAECGAGGVTIELSTRQIAAGESLTATYVDEGVHPRGSTVLCGFWGTFDPGDGGSYTSWVSQNIEVTIPDEWPDEGGG